MPANLPSLLDGCDLAIDALDNLPSRYALNQAIVKVGIPLIHGAVSGFDGQAMTVLPGRTACLMCLFRGAESAGPVPVLGSAPSLIGSIEATEAIKVLAGRGTSLGGRLLVYDGLEMTFHKVEIKRDPLCPHCGARFRTPNVFELFQPVLETMGYHAGFVPLEELPRWKESRPLGSDT